MPIQTVVSEIPHGPFQVLKNEDDTYDVHSNTQKVRVSLSADEVIHFLCTTCEGYAQKLLKYSTNINTGQKTILGNAK